MKNSEERNKYELLGECNHFHFAIVYYSSRPFDQICQKDEQRWGSMLRHEWR